jgi:hypothetical protein
VKWRTCEEICGGKLKSEGMHYRLLREQGLIMLKLSTNPDLTALKVKYGLAQADMSEAEPQAF